jgi:DNA-binding FadR family transcriptional regulator
LTNASNLGMDLHRDIYEAIRRCNPVAARQAVRRLMKSTLADVHSALKVILSEA